MNSAATTDQPTPGYNRRMTFAFTTDKRGRPVAYYWGRNWRWFRAPYEASKLLVAQELADETAYTGNASKRLG
jgi:hypothetical protein